MYNILAYHLVSAGEGIEEGSTSLSEQSDQVCRSLLQNRLEGAKGVFRRSIRQLVNCFQNRMKTGGVLKAG